MAVAILKFHKHVNSDIAVNFKISPRYKTWHGNKSNMALGNGVGCPTCMYIRIDSRDDQSLSKM